MDLQVLADITDVESLRAIIAAHAQQLVNAEAVIAREKAETNKRDTIIGLLRTQLKLLRHGKYSASSEKANQLELMLEDLEANRAEALAAIPMPRTETAAKDKPSRQPRPIICRGKSGCMMRRAPARIAGAPASSRRRTACTKCSIMCPRPSRSFATLRSTSSARAAIRP